MINFFKLNSVLFIFIEKQSFRTTFLKLKNKIYFQIEVLLFLNADLFIFCIMLILSLCYYVSMTISRPLRKLIQIASLINNNATEKNFIKSIQNNLPDVI